MSSEQLALNAGHVTINAGHLALGQDRTIQPEVLMKQKQSYVRDTLVNVQRFLDANAAALESVNSSGGRKVLDEAIAALDGHAIAQAEHRIGSTGETQKQRSLRLTLRRQFLRPIAKVAAATLGDVPELATLRLPPITVVGAPLVDAANAIANAAAPYTATFVAAGLRPDFLDGLRALTQQIEASLGGRTDHTAKRRGSTIGLESGTAQGRRALHLLDAAIHQTVTDEQLLAEWNAARRIPSKPGPVRTAATPQDVRPASPTASPTAPPVAVASPAPAVPAEAN